MSQSLTRLRKTTTADAASVVELNQEVVEYTSPMDMARYHALLKLSSYASIVEHQGHVVGFLLAMEKSSPYDNKNFNWFSNLYENFIYIDRIVIASKSQGLGLGRLLYSDLSKWATQKGLTYLTAEIDIAPPNLGSLKFHKNHGFHEVGKQLLDNGKTVSMQIKNL